MPLQIIHRDITTMDCDAIVNPTDNCFSGSGGTDYAIHTAAGLGLRYECDHLEPLSFGEVAATGGYKLPCRYIIHTMGPVWTGGQRCESVLLRSCYMNALFKASELGAKSIAFPLISSGTFGFPKDKVLRIAIDAISDYIKSSDKEIDVTVCVHDREAFVLSKEIALKEYIDEKFIIDNVGKTFSANSIVKFLKSEGRSLSVETIYNYLVNSRTVRKTQAIHTTHSVTLI